MTRPARRAVPSLSPLQAALAAWARAPNHRLSWLAARLGVGLGWLQRVAAGEIEPVDGAAEALWRAVKGEAAEAPQPEAEREPAYTAAGFALANGARGRSLVQCVGEIVHLFTLDQACSMHAELGQLLAIDDDPGKAAI